MRYIPLDSLADEIEIASHHSLYSGFNIGRLNPHGGHYQLLLTTKAALKHHHIEKIQALGVEHLCIQDALTDDIVIKEPISEESYLEFEHWLHTLQKKLYPLYLQLQKIYIDPNSFTTHYRSKVHTLMGKENIPAKMMTTLKNIYNEYLLSFRAHPVYSFTRPVSPTSFQTLHVLFNALLGVKTYTKLGYLHEQNWNLFAGIALQDIGVWREFFQADTITTEEDKIYREHPKLGLMIINETPIWNPFMGIATLNHHRYTSHSGFPKSTTIKNLYDYERGMHVNGKVARFANVVGTYSLFYAPSIVAKIVDALYHEAPFEQELWKYLKPAFLTCPEGMALELKNGARGIVKPTENAPWFSLRLIYDENGKRLRKKVDVELFPESDRIKGPWFVDAVLKERVLKYYPDVDQII